MSDPSLAQHGVSYPARRPADRGMTLPELLIAVTVLGLIAAVLSSAIIVTLRQGDNTEGRLNVARAEQSISLWLPADLASVDADGVDTSAGSSPCGASTCDGIDLSTGSNVLMLTWTSDDGSGNTTTTKVSYHFRPAGNDGLYELLRVECINGACSSMIVLHDLPGPPGGEPFVAGVPNGANCLPTGTVPCTEPTWVIIVSKPLRADAIDDSEESLAKTTEELKNANRVVVTINGGGDSEGAGGGINQISITAGGTVRTTISSNSLQGAPTFTQALSLCGGPMTLVIDESNSIGAAITDVENGVKAFIEALAGTPVKLQVVRFQTYSSVLASSAWQEYFDMTDPADVQMLLDHVTDLQGSWSSDSTQKGGTNWEEALFRTFYNANGTTASVIPETVVFFTDGVPTFDRLVHLTSPGVLPAEPPAPVAPWPASTGGSYSQVAFNRANYIANAFRRSVRFIGVGVGSGITSSSNWIVDPGAGYRYVWERGYRQYQVQSGNGPESNIDFEKSTTVETNLDFEKRGTPQSNLDTEQATVFTSNVDFEQRQSGSWRDRTPTQYYTNNTTNDSTDNWRINGTRSEYSVTYTELRNYASYLPSNWFASGWTNTTLSTYYGNNVNSTEIDGWRIATPNRSWYTISQAEYDSYQSLSPSNYQGGAWTDAASPTEYYTNNTTTTESDGWRINGTRTSWYTATSTEYNSYSSQNPSNWRRGGWADAASPTEYYTNNTTTTDTDGWRINGSRAAWYSVTQAEYDARNTTSDASDGWRLTPLYSWIPKAEYDAHNTTSDATDGYIDVGTPEYVTASLAKDWVEWTGTRSGDSTSYRQTKLYNSPPYDGYDPAITAGTSNSVILARLISGNDYGTPGQPTGGPYTNTDVADMYVLPNWNQFQPAMKQIALGECGGTLTIQTKVGGTTPAKDPFTYQRASVKDADGNVLAVDPHVVTTSQQFTTGTFDLPVDDGRFVTVEILPQQFDQLKGYTPTGWSCKAGVTPRSVELIPVSGAWKGIRLTVAANEAVSCTLSVSKT